jgi:glycosyltransferase involved in cell wall biosynthesis
MQVILVTTAAPYIYGGAALLVDWLDAALRRRGHEVETYRIPFLDDPAQIPTQMVGLRMWNFTGHGDRLIAVRTPSYLVRHHSKVVWFLHHQRPVYDMWDTHACLPPDPDSREFRRMMFAADDVALSECKRIFTNSCRVSDRLKRFNDLSSEVLYPPLDEGSTFASDAPGDTLVYVSRLFAHKRQLLAVQAIAHTRTPVKLILAGRDDSSTGYADNLYQEIDRLGVADRVSLVNTVVSEETKRALMASALGIVFVPEDEDSYGFVGLEAAKARKPLVTVSDSGGVLELVQHGVNGLIAEPNPMALAAAFDRLYADRDAAAGMGSALAARTSELNITWDHVVDRLLS